MAAYLQTNIRHGAMIYLDASDHFFHLSIVSAHHVYVRIEPIYIQLFCRFR